MTNVIDLLDGEHLSEVEIDERGFLQAGRVTNLDTGASWRYVYRSPAVRPGKTFHNRMLEWLDGAAPVGDAHVHQDAEMLNGIGELTLWEP